MSLMNSALDSQRGNAGRVDENTDTVDMLVVFVEILLLFVDMLLVFVATSPDRSMISAALIAPVAVIL